MGTRRLQGNGRIINSRIILLLMILPQQRTTSSGRPENCSVKFSNGGRATDAEIVSKVECLWSGIRAYGMVVNLIACLF